ncbi:hypothetical protein SKAU_G00151410 [Synaphobranchus kaupii]|uniref:Uncharacterized protein n=1 Tax=Synaphobranchus kaupii TaxID=118154 RepID=A0A9Q1FGT0_SYNKA|nr:hypothetical protein SKAU_G00151410 [Synaphobranchus kaupii]
MDLLEDPSYDSSPSIKEVWTALRPTQNALLQNRGAGYKLSRLVPNAQDAGERVTATHRLLIAMAPNHGKAQSTVRPNTVSLPAGTTDQNSGVRNLEESRRQSAGRAARVCADARRRVARAPATPGRMYR